MLINISKLLIATFWSGLKGRINFLQMGRFSKFCEQYFRIGFQKKFDFLTFNSILLEKHLSTDLAIALDPSYMVIEPVEILINQEKPLMVIEPVEIRCRSLLVRLCRKN